jgi:hypothetical protein
MISVIRIPGLSPWEEILDVRGQKSLLLAVRLVNAKGRLLASKFEGEASSRWIARDDLVPGIYFIRVLREDGFEGYTIHPHLKAATASKSHERMVAGE